MTGKQNKTRDSRGDRVVVVGGATPGVGEQKMGHYVGMEAACPSRRQRRRRRRLKV